MNNLAVKEKAIIDYEAVGIFDDVDNLQAAIDDLEINGFMWHELSILADDKTVEKKLGHIYRRVEEAEDDPSAPRKIFISNEMIGEAKGVIIGLPLYIAATIAAVIVVASGGTLLNAIIVATIAGTAGMAIGSVFAFLIAKRRADHIEKQIKHGGLLLWVKLRTPDMAGKAEKILSNHSAYDVHIHEIPLTASYFPGRR